MPARWWHHLLHNQRALLIKGALLFQPNTVVDERALPPPGLMQTGRTHARDDVGNGYVPLGAGTLAAVLLGLALVPLRGEVSASNLSFAFMALTIVTAELAAGRRRSRPRSPRR